MELSIPSITDISPPPSRSLQLSRLMKFTSFRHSRLRISKFSEITSPFHRFAMVALATDSIDRFRTSTIEVDALEKRYTVQTLEAMKRAYPGAQLLFIIGTDMYQELESWKDYRRLFELAHLAIVNRPGFPFREDLAPFQILKETQTVPLPAEPAVFYLPFVEQPISSTEIRDDRRRGAQVSQWLPPMVWNYIEKTNFIRDRHKENKRIN